MKKLFLLLVIFITFISCSTTRTLHYTIDQRSKILVVDKEKHNTITDNNFVVKLFNENDNQELSGSISKINYDKMEVGKLYDMYYLAEFFISYYDDNTVDEVIAIIKKIYYIKEIPSTN